MGSTVEKIKDRLSITDVLSSYLKLEKAGQSFKARCPFHNEKTPSFVVSPIRGTFYCFGCGAKGDIFSFIERFEGLDFKGALKVLADRAGVEMVREDPQKRDEREQLFSVLEEATEAFEHNLEKQEEVLEYLESRGLRKSTLRAWRIGYALPEWRGLTDYLHGKGFTNGIIEKAGLAKQPAQKEELEEGGEEGRMKHEERSLKEDAPLSSAFHLSSSTVRLYDRFRGRIMFPFFDASGRVIGFSGRIFPKDGAKDGKMTGEGKYINSPETDIFRKSLFLYGMHRAKEGIRKLGFSLVVEGQMDLLHCHQAGYVNAVALSGTALSDTQVAFLRRFSDKILLALDSDEAGVNAAHKSAAAALAHGMEVKILSVGDGKDPADMISTSRESFKEAIRDAKHAIPFFLEYALEADGEKKEQEGNLRKRQKKALRFILPLLRALKSPMDCSHFLSLSAKKLSVSEQVLSEELSMFERNVEPQNSFEAAGSSDAKTGGRLSRRFRIVRRMAAIMALTERGEWGGFDREMFMMKVSSLLPEEEKEAARSDPSLEQEIFSAESSYDTVLSLHKEARELLLWLEKEILQESYETVQVKIRDCESEQKDTTDLEQQLSEGIKKIRRLEMLLQENEESVASQKF